ncbi:hypothetical protein ABZW49_15930 [Nonomuraea wenchangensis]
MSTMDFGTVLNRLYPWYDGDVRAQLFALMCDVAFVWASSDEIGDFNLSLDCVLEGIEENVREMRVEYHLGPLSLLLPAASRLRLNDGADGDV